MTTSALQPQHKLTTNLDVRCNKIEYNRHDGWCVLYVYMMPIRIGILILISEDHCVFSIVSFRIALEKNIKKRLVSIIVI